MIEFRLPLRVLKRIGRAALARVRKFRRNVLFPVRNRLIGNYPLRICVCGTSLKFTPHGAFAAGTWSGEKGDKYQVEFLMKLIYPGAVFFDIGANVGFFAIALGKKEPQARIYAFEPCSESFRRLSKNIAMNGPQNVMPFQIAVGDYNGITTLNLNEPGRDGLNTIGQPSHPDSRIRSREEVPITTVKKFLTDWDIQGVDFLKVDVEGAELSVLVGAKELLSAPSAPLILYEGFSFCTKGFGYHPIEIQWLLRDCGYEIFKLEKDGRLRPGREQRSEDAIWVAVKRAHKAFSSLWTARQ